MKRFILLLSLLFTLNLYGQNNKPIRDIRYYNSLEWKNDASLKVYIDCTYTLPLENKNVNKKPVNYYYVSPYRYSYPYMNNYRYYYPYGYNMGYYIPLRFDRHHNHHNNHR